MQPAGEDGVRVCVYVCVVKMKFTIAHVVYDLELPGTKTEAIKYNHNLDVHQSFLKRIFTKLCEIVRISSNLQCTQNNS